MKKIIALFDKLGYNLSKKQDDSGSYIDIKDKNFWEAYHVCRPFTMTSVERMYALFN